MKPTSNIKCVWRLVFALIQLVGVKSDQRPSYLSWLRTGFCCFKVSSLSILSTSRLFDVSQNLSLILEKKKLYDYGAVLFTYM